MKNELIFYGYIVGISDDNWPSDNKRDILINNSVSRSPFGLFDEVRTEITNQDGVKSYCDRKRCICHSIDIIPNACIRIYYMNEESTIEEAANSLAAKFDGEYYLERQVLGYSEFTITGYEIECSRIGGHDLYEEIKSHIGEYMIFSLKWKS